MKKTPEELLKEFQSGYYRRLEEDFARTLSEDEFIRLFFINNDQAFTDGAMVVVDPATHDLYKDKMALCKITDILGWDMKILADTWNVLRITTRAQTIHECLHLLYSDFPSLATNDPLCNTRNKKTVMNLISNIVEDYYIEAAGSSVYDNLSIYLRYSRVSKLFAHKQVQGTAQRTLANATQEEKKNDLVQKAVLTPDEETILQQLLNLQILLKYIDYMAGLVLYPFLKHELPDADIAKYVEVTWPDFQKGMRASGPAKRYAYCQKIFKVIEHLIPPDIIQMGEPNFKYLVGGEKTHQGGNSIGGKERKGREQEVTGGLFENRDSKEEQEKLQKDLEEFKQQREQGKQTSQQQKEKIEELNGEQLGAPPVHNQIKVFEVHPAIRNELKVAYQNIYRKHKININRYNSKFSQLLQAHVQHREEKFFFGNGITSSRLGDIKKRYWHRNVDGVEMPDLAVLVLVDGSGSMRGERQEAATNATLILHEVLATQHISHAIVEHRAHGEKPEMEANVLVGFRPRPQEQLNIMRISAHGDNRDGLALYWGARYLTQNVSNDYKLIIVISDGCPAHAYDDYYGAVGVQDTARAVKKLEQQGIHVVAIALDEEGSYDCYDDLAPIYPHLIHCDNLKRLTGSLLGVVAKLL